MDVRKNRSIEANGIRIHLAEQGSGPLVLLCHGFPESWYSWRHQLAALSRAGFHAVAPDMRGYGQSSRPEQIDRYSMLHLVGDMVGVLDALGAKQAVIAGHDWGAPVAWHAALLRPDRFRAVIGLSVPYRPRGSVAPTTVMAQTDEAQFYQLYFQTPGTAETELEADTRHSIRKILYSWSGEMARRTADDARGAQARGAQAPAAVGMVPRSGGLLSRIPEPPALPPWLTDADIEVYVEQFRNSGFRGGLNWYRNIDRNWELLAAFTRAPVTVPALYVAGELDPVVTFPRMQEAIADLPRFIPQLRASILLPGCGHWTQQERPDQVNAAMIEFLRGL
jgi:pimeloyl-ACP methyl ester carboxylesterase